MDIQTAILTRRSTRKFTSDPVGEEMLETLLRAAMSAPSAGDEQPWHFLVIKDGEMLSRIPQINPNAAPAANTTTAVLALGDLGLERYPGYWVLDLAAACENLLLAAHGLGLGAVWTGIYPDQDRMKGFRKMFKLPKDIMPHSLILIGHPVNDGIYSERPDRFRKDRVHYDHW